LNLKVRASAAMELPAELVGKDQFKAGDTVELECTLLTHCGAYRFEWEGAFTLRE
jgi:antitoxin component of MazEF toxin-antitoxin module